jgi:D-alanine-D-alanine ligase
MVEGKLCIGVIFGGRSGEHEVSLQSAASVVANLNPEKYTVIQIGITHEGAWVVGEGLLEAWLAGREVATGEAVLLPEPGRQSLYALHSEGSWQVFSELSSLDVVFPVLHGTYGEDGTLQGLLELADLAYVGAGVLGSALGMDKGVFKDVMRAQGIPVLESIVVLRSEIDQDIEVVLQRAEALAAYPLFVKPANLGSSVGITKCQSRSDLFEGLIEAARFDRRVLIERGIHAREIEVSVLGNESPTASVPGEILPSREFYSYEAKYLDGTSGLVIPAALSPETTQLVQEYAVQAYRAIDCAGMARVDFLLERRQTFGPGDGLYLSEINTIPGFTQISMYPKLWEASGLAYPELLDQLIELALSRKAQRDTLTRRYQREV